jgi:hypothetical protein
MSNTLTIVASSPPLAPAPTVTEAAYQAAQATQTPGPNGSTTSTATAAQLGVITWAVPGETYGPYELAVNLTPPGVGVRSMQYWANYNGPNQPVTPDDLAAWAEYQALLAAGAIS